MENVESLCAIDMRLILKMMDALDDISHEGMNAGFRFSGNIKIFDEDDLKGVIQLDEDLTVYVPAVCPDCAPVIETESEGAK
jgi:hypothetical protein